MKNALSILLILMFFGKSFGQPANKNQQKEKLIDAGSVSNTKISIGASGVKRSIPYSFSSSPDTDPGNGQFSIDNADIRQIRYLLADNIDFTGEDQSQWFSTWDKSTGATGRGQIIIVDQETEKTIVLDVRDVFTRENGYWKIPVTYISGPGPENGKVYYYIFNRIATRKPSTVNEQIKPAASNDQKPVTAAGVPLQEPIAETIVKPVPVSSESEQSPVIITDTNPVTSIDEVKPVISASEAGPTSSQTADPGGLKEEEIKEEPVVIQQYQATKEPSGVQVEAGSRKPAPVPSANTSARNNMRTPSSRSNIEYQQVERTSKVSTNIPAEQTTGRSTGQPPAGIRQTEAGTKEIPAKQVSSPSGSAITSQPGQPSVRSYVTTVPTQSDNVSSAPPAYQPGLPVYNPVSAPYATGRSRGKWYSGIIEAGYGAGLGDYGINNFRLNFINGFYIGPTFTVGLGLGLRKYYPGSYPEKTVYTNKTRMPVFLDLRKRFSTGTVTPYMAFGIGNSVSFIKDQDSTRTVNDGMMINGSGGIWINLTQRFAIFAGLAYESEKFEYVWTDDSHSKKNGGSVSLNIGIAF